MRTIGSSAAVLVLVFALGCGGGGGGGGSSGGPCFDDPQEWGFNFYHDGTFFTRGLVTMEATRNITKLPIPIDVPGCTLTWLCDVQFSGSQVRLLNFTVDPSSTCGNVMLEQGTGTATANGNYGEASEVVHSSSSGILRYKLGGNSVGGPFTFEAFLCPVPTLTSDR